MGLREITDAGFADAAAGALVLLFTSPWCVGCHKVGEELESLEQGFPQVVFGKLDISANPLTPEAFGVLGIPTIIMFKAGHEVGRLAGEVRAKVLQRELEKLAC